MYKSNNMYLICSGLTSCGHSSICNINNCNVFGLGFRSLYNANIKSNDYGPLNVYLYGWRSSGDSSFPLKVDCIRNQTCHLYCYSINECMNVNTTGTNECNIIVMNVTANTTMAPTTIPTTNPTQDYINIHYGSFHLQIVILV